MELFGKLSFVLAILVLNLSKTVAVWMCESDEDCGELTGSVCTNNKCVCPVGFEVVDSGRRCAEVAPYHFSRCEEDHQCSRLFIGFQCYKEESTGEGTCRCLPTYHYFLGRCWQTRDLGESCSRNEECRSPVLNNPGAMQCKNSLCECSDGYFLRQRGECRRIGRAVGDGCVLDVDCQFENGVCDFRSRTCYDSTVGDKPEPEEEKNTMNQTKTTKNKMASRSHVACRDNEDCEDPFICSSIGLCTCPLGYYGIEGECFAEIGSPASEIQCQGLFNIVEDGRCVCPANFFAERSMRDCVKAAMRFGDSCITDEMCHTFGAASVCGAPGEWQLRRCDCIEGLAVKEVHNSMCRLFATIGDHCEVDSDCMAGNMEIECNLHDDGKKRCECPEGFKPVGNLCLQGGLVLGDVCQATEECTGTDNSVCDDGVCACDIGFGQSGDYCLPVIGSACAHDDDCIVNNTTCQEIDNKFTCQCKNDFVEMDEECWEVSLGHNSTCQVDEQCMPTLGVGGFCDDGHCDCMDGYHFNKNYCWQKTGLRQPCITRSQCYLGAFSERVVCRNSFCDCHFDYPYDEILNTCLSRSSASNIFGNVMILMSVFIIQLLCIKIYFGR